MKKTIKTTVTATVTTAPNQALHIALLAAEHGYRVCEKGNNLQVALANIRKMHTESAS